MCDADMLREYGLLGAFDTVANMLGERVAVVYGYSKQQPEIFPDEEEAAEEVVEEFVEEGDGEEIEQLHAHDVDGDDEGKEEGNAEVDDEEAESDNDEDEEEIIHEGVPYHELQYYSHALSTVL